MNLGQDRRMQVFLLLVLPAGLSGEIQWQLDYCTSILLQGSSLPVKLASEWNAAVHTDFNSSLLSLAFSLAAEKNTFFFSPRNLEEFKLTLTQAEQFFLNKRKSNWLPVIFILLPKSVVHNVTKIIEGEKWRIPIDANLYFLDCTVQFKCNDVVELYSIKGELFLENMGTGEVLDSLDDVVKGRIRRRMDFRGIFIRGVSKEFQFSSEYETIDEETQLFRLTGGFEVHQFWYLRDALNFREEALKWPNYLRQGPNGTLTGLAVPVNQELADICFSTIEFLLYRVQGPHRISYLHVSYLSQMKALFVQPPLSSVRDLHRAAFSGSAWGSLFTMWIFMALVIYATMSCGKEVDPNIPKEPTSVFMWIISCTTLQGWVPKKVLSREVVVVGSLFGVVCVSAFAGSLVSLFTAPVVPIKSLDDLLLHNFFIYSDTTIPSSAQHVQDMQRLGMLLKLPEEARNVEVGSKIEELKKGSAIISFTESMFPALMGAGIPQEDLCFIFSTIDVESEPIKTAMFVKRGSPLRKTFNVKVARMMEGGIGYRNMNNHFLKMSSTCLREYSKRKIPVEIGDLLSGYIVLLSGHLVAFVLIALEYIYSTMVY